MLLDSDMHSRFWAVLADKGYIGPETDTPDFRRVTPIKKNRLSIVDQAFNEEQRKARVPIECFFGRVMKLWGVVENVYRFNHKNFDMDFENACLLTNYHIRDHDLDDEDWKFYHNYLSARIKKQEEKLQKEKMANEQAHVKKKQRLLHVEATVLTRK